MADTKKIIFKIILAAIPVLFFIVLELTLQIFNYGGDQELFVPDQSTPEQDYILNKNFTKKYFFKKGIKTPEPLSQKFKMHKDSSTYRIFCLGASTTQGFPYKPNAAFPAQLKNILVTLHPERDIEVINCGVTAITSHSVLDMAEEIVDNYQPDLLVVYSGHNEFYGILGQASNFGLFSNYTYIRMFLKLQHFKTFLLLRNSLVYFLDDPVTRDGKEDKTTLMSLIAERSGVEYNSPVFERTQQHFKENLERISQLAAESHTKLLFCNLIDNVRDQQPLSAPTNEKKLADINSSNKVMIDSIKTLQNNNLHEKSIVLLQKLLQQDSTNALLHFYLAKSHEALNTIEKATMHYYAAKDYDQIRFRAPTVFNKIIQQVADENNVPLVDVEEAVRRSSNNRLIGYNFVHEHIHPTFEGYFIIAKTIAKAMAADSLITTKWDWSKDKQYRVYLNMCWLTDLDHEVAKYLIFSLTSSWPFTQNEERVYVPFGNEETARLARLIVDNENVNVIQTHLDLGKEYLDNNETLKGLAEYRAALAIEPHCDIFNRVGPVYTKASEIASKKGDFHEAYLYFKAGLEYFKEGLKNCPEHLQLNFNLGLLYALRTDKYEEALGCFNKVLELDPDHKNARVLIIKLQLRNKDFNSAKNSLMEAINRHTAEISFYHELSTLYSNENNFAAARIWLEKALQLNPENLKTKSMLLEVNSKKPTEI